MFPATSAGTSLQVGMANRKIHGVRAASTPLHDAYHLPHLVATVVWHDKILLSWGAYLPYKHSIVTAGGSGKPQSDEH